MKINVIVEDDTQGLGYVGWVKYRFTGKPLKRTVYIKAFTPLMDTIPF